ncbi:uncharacterized protein LOC122509705 [Leptopilina heterotoma]|uniref:uncharacterized protein LOC122509705 n=1 Tax=Leptopilina heterotoma TaxID=63436 RepID=UPI001CA8CC65|nr:uncharacterized protein LOC122509705 [Leptopilina heterotoma]
MIKFGLWEPAPSRASSNETWHFSRLLRDNTSARPFSRSCWHQEYYWDAIRKKYRVRGFWATKHFRHPLLVEHPSSELMLRTGLNAVPNTETCLFQSLPQFPPHVGFFSKRDSFRLTFVQVFFKTAAGVHKQADSWQLTYNVELPESWETIGSEGHLFGGRRDNFSEEKCTDAGAEESEEDWF